MKDEVELHGRDGHATANAPVSGGTGVPPVKIRAEEPAMSLRYISAYGKCRGQWNYSDMPICLRRCAVGDDENPQHRM